MHLLEPQGRCTADRRLPAGQLCAYGGLTCKPLQAASVRDAAGGATAAVAAHVQPRNVAAVVPFLLDGMAPACAWQTKVLSHLIAEPLQGCEALGGHALQCMHVQCGVPAHRCCSTAVQLIHEQGSMQFPVTLWLPGRVHCKDGLLLHAI